MLGDLRQAARGLLRAPWLALALVVTIAVGVGSNAAVLGFIRGFVAPGLPIPGIEHVVSVFARDAQDAFVPVSYDHFLEIQSRASSFEWVAAAREQQSVVVLNGKSLVVASASITRELADVYQI